VFLLHQNALISLVWQMPLWTDPVSALFIALFQICKAHYYLSNTLRIVYIKCNL